MHFRALSCNCMHCFEKSEKSKKCKFSQIQNVDVFLLLHAIIVFLLFDSTFISGIFSSIAAREVPELNFGDTAIQIECKTELKLNDSKICSKIHDYCFSLFYLIMLLHIYYISITLVASLQCFQQYRLNILIQFSLSSELPFDAFHDFP